jgi:hypothetical protein
MKKIMFITLGSIVLIILGFTLGKVTSIRTDLESVSFDDSTDASVLSYSINEVEEVFDDSNQYETFLTLHQSLILTHQSIRSQFVVFHTLRTEIKEVRYSFRENNIKLSREDKINLWTKYHELLDLRDLFKLTADQGYQQLEELIGLYDAEHIDLVISTYEDVLQVLMYRLDILNQGISILEESLVTLQNYTHM